MADRLSDRIVDAVNVELAAMGGREQMDPLQILAGQLLGLRATARTFPPVVPDEIARMMDAVDDCLKAILETKRGKQ